MSNKLDHGEAEEVSLKGIVYNFSVDFMMLLINLTYLTSI